MENSSKKLGLALSGGGYRAAVYHIGTFRALKKMGLLKKLNVISSNSGGSITAGAYSLYHNDFEKFENTIKKGVKREIVWQAAILLIIVLGGIFTARYWVPFDWPPIVFSSINLITIAGLFFLQFKLFPISRFIEFKYNQIFFHRKKLKDLSPDFKTTINSTNVETGRIFYFSKESMTDSTYLVPSEGEERINFKHEDFPIARAVMASSCVPGAFSPVLIARKFYQNPADARKINPKLVDGGVYDNQGIHKLTFPKSSSYCENVIVSDAGNFLPTRNWTFNALLLLIRTGSIFMTRIKNMQMMANLYREDNYSTVAFQSLGYRYEKCLGEFIKMLQNGHIDQVVIDAHGISPADIEAKNWSKIQTQVAERINLNAIITQGCTQKELAIARNVKTGLSKLSNEKINALIKHAEVITEIQVKLFLPHVL